MNLDGAKGFSLEEYREFVVWWNNTFPVDLWWRRKYSVAFNSPQHRVTSFVDMLFEYIEEKTIKEYIEGRKLDEEKREDYLVTGKWISRQHVFPTEEEIDKWFDNFDIAEYNKHQALKKNV